MSGFHTHKSRGSSRSRGRKTGSQQMIVDRATIRSRQIIALGLVMRTSPGLPSSYVHSSTVGLWRKSFHWHPHLSSRPGIFPPTRDLGSVKMSLRVHGACCHQQVALARSSNWLPPHAPLPVALHPWTRYIFRSLLHEQWASKALDVSPPLKDSFR